MESASKALIIAGAILISILIVGLGVIIYNNVSGIATQDTMSQQQISAHNSPFTAYFGNSVQGANVRALITAVNSNNQSARVNGEEVGNLIFLVDEKGTAIKSSDIKTGRTYNVNLPAEETYTDDVNIEYTSGDGAAYWKNGFIKRIIIIDNSQTK